jgi:cytochrome c oxidase subunit IV
MAQQHGSRGPHAEAHAHGHPHDHLHDGAAPPHVGWKKYSFIGLILAIVTAAEVLAVEYHILPTNLLVPIVMVLTAAKFFLVVLYYMHLKMDHAIFGRVFWAPMFLSVLVVVGLILLFHVIPNYGKFSN